MIGFLATTSVNELGKDGLFYGGGWSVLGTQAIGAGAVLLYSFVITIVLGLVLKAVLKFRISKEDEVSGIDLAEHAETAYDYAPSSGGVLTGRAVAHADYRSDAMEESR